MIEGEKQDVTLGEVATNFIAGLQVEEREIIQQEVNRFVRWYGWERAISELRIPEVANFAERTAASAIDPVKRLEPVKRFLVYTKKEGLIKTNLAAHLRVRKSALKTKKSVKHQPIKSHSLTRKGYSD